MPSNRLLVIDDEPASSATIGRIARGCGYDTIITTDADDFRSRITTWAPTVIVLDLTMPDMDGFQIIEWLATQNCVAHILIVSGSEPIRLMEAEALGRSLALNVVGSLTKPLRVEQLRSVFLQIYDDVGALSVQDLSRALSNHEVRLVYQPQVDLQDGTTVGFEALARWDHPKRGPIPPDLFIPMFEDNSIINDFTARIFELAIADMLSPSSTADYRIAINVSAANCASMALNEILQSTCAVAGVDCRRITIEVTETAAMAETRQVSTCLRELSESGVQLSIDDFGTGYSSLVKLHQLPFAELKIDKSFVLDCSTNLRSQVLVQSMIDLAHKLDKKVVAEGVEDEETLYKLREWGCDIVQGYYISKPIPPAEARQWLLRGPYHWRPIP